jgi:acyl carrier protein
VTSATQERITQIVASIFHLPAGSITPETSPQTVPAWDSVEHLNLILALEQEFQITFEPEDIEQLTSVAAIEQVVAKKQAEQ